MRGALLVCLTLAACGDDPPTGPLAYHITHYDYTFDVESRAAHAEVTLAVDTGGDCFDIPFRADGAANATIDGDAVSAAPDGTKLMVCGTGYETGSTIKLGIDVQIKLATVGPSQVGYSVTQDTDGNKLYYLVSWVGGCDQFGPCDSRPDQFATYKFTVTHPASFKTRCPGTITEPSATQTVCDFTLAGGPTYSTFGVATYPAWTESDKGTWGGIKVTLYDRASTTINAAIDSAWHDGYMTWMQATFGPYPFGNELRVLTAPTYWSGFEHPGNIVLDDSLAKLTRPRYWSETAHVLDHEIAHQWAGDQTTLKDTYDFVWKESMAEYLAYVYEDMQDPAKSLVTARYWKTAAAAAEYFPVPGEKPALFDYYGDVYGEGPMILFHQLETMYGRDKVIAALQKVLGKEQAIGVDDVIAALQETTGTDLSAYAAAWIHGSGAPDWPKYNVTFTPGSLSLTMMNKKSTPRGCMFHVALEGANTGESLVMTVDTRTAQDQTIPVAPLSFTVTKVTLDPYAECLVYKASGTPRMIRENPWVSEH
ncbi:MAG TPA: M1 family aminopeptidase [Kofleriaceae bacterium]|nr:M1 family aminopeptidase [Kofleriaceae bacterium]